MIYNGEHSITFIDGAKSINTWNDWHLIPTSKPFINPPSIKTHYLDIPGSDGLIDFTDSISGEPKYSTREGSFNFIIANDFEEWIIIYDNIRNFLHGKRMIMILEDDPGYKYEGRFSINEFSSQKDNSKIVINYLVDPLKIELIDSITPWKWDPFNFYDGVITYNQSYIFESEGPHKITCPFVGKDISPIFRVSDSSNLKLIFDQKEYDLEDGDNYIPFVFLKEDKKEFEFKGNGEVKVIYSIRRF